MISHFLSRLCKLLLHPEDPCYGSLCQFVLAKPTMDLQNVPEFYRLFNSTSTEFHDRERLWILTLLAEGVRQPQGYWMLEKRCGLFLSLAVRSSTSRQRHHCLVVMVISGAYPGFSFGGEGVGLRPPRDVKWGCVVSTVNRYNNLISE